VWRAFAGNARTCEQASRAAAATYQDHDWGWMRANDPSAGSPTETLLRLLLPLSDKVYTTLRRASRICEPGTPKNSPDHSIGRSDGRCVQRAGT
jgi:hypothetical protein